MVRGKKLQQAFLWSALAAGLAVTALCVLCAWGIQWHRGIPVDLGWLIEHRGNRSIVRVVDPHGPAGGKLVPGDQILAVNQSPRGTYAGQLDTLRINPRPYSIDIQRAGKRLRFVLTPQTFLTPAWQLYCYLFLAALNLGLAFWIGSARPENRAARIALFLFLGTAQTFAAFVFQQFQPPLYGLALGCVLLITSNA